ncbi:T9SS type A sorting domain-containing protein [Paenimyroides tangerinum]|uniref:T9SS type A sorting domain-containing protein n=1 Tax=Paenimyroides tangerinum TaxID=2488728 RepID=UPI0029393B6A|nr:T9SS type A sorting domain-containing protein [Paenimyroides tangerinum]
MLINAEEGAKLLELASQQKAVFEEHNLLNHQQIEYDLYHDGTEALLATICWTDPATNPVVISESIIPVLVNDLDLRIINSNTNEIYYPWRINKSWSNIYTTKGDNDVDPIEQVVLPALAPAGNYKVRITHKDELVGNSQKFSLIVSGGITEFSYSLDAKKSEFDKIIIFPNPTSDLIYLTNFNYDSIEIYDLTGSQFSINYFNDLAFIKLDLTFLDNGIYLLKVLCFLKCLKLLKNNSGFC